MRKPEEKCVQKKGDLQRALLNVVDDLSVESARSEAIINSIADGMIITNREGRILRVNNVFEKLLGWKRAEVVGKDMLDVVVKVDENGNVIPRSQRSITRILSGEVKFMSESTFITTHQYIKKDGSKMPVVGTVSPIILKGKIVGAIQLFRDVTKEKELDIMKDQFMDIAAHDLRTPATAVRGFISRVLDGDGGKIPDKARELLEEAYEGNLRSIRLVDDFLAVSRLERGTMKIVPKAGDLAKIIDFSMKGLSGLTKSQGLTIEYKKVTLPPVLFDEERIVQVLNNLIGNAIKFTCKGGVTINHEVTKDEVITNVTDTGQGIPAHTQQQLFSKYYKGDENIRRSGLGLGLYISRLCVEGMNGRIWVKSKAGEGSTFSFSLPLAKKPSHLL